MRIGSHDTAEKVFVIAEAGNNHEGNFAAAEELVGRAAEAGADAIKFQTIIPERLVHSGDKARIAQLKRFQFSYEQFESLAKTAAKAGIVFFSTPFDLETAKFLDTIQPVFKIASGDNTFLPLIDTVLGLGKPTIISTGLADAALLGQLHALWMGKKGGGDLAFLHCVASYPVPTDQANLSAIFQLKIRFPNVSVGYSDHTLGIEAAALSVAAGARIVEKHFTLDKKRSDFRDHQLSADPDDMRRLVERIREVAAMMGRGEKKDASPCEEALRTPLRRSIAAARDIDKDTVLTPGHLTWVRPGIGIAPGGEDKLLGKKVARPLAAGQIINLADVAP